MIGFGYVCFRKRTASFKAALSVGIAKLNARIPPTRDNRGPRKASGEKSANLEGKPNRTSFGIEYHTDSDEITTTKLEKIAVSGILRESPVKNIMIPPTPVT